MISEHYKKLLNDIAAKCTSVSEFKLECVVRGVNVPDNDVHFLKWLWSIACGNRKYPAFLFPGEIVWKSRIWEYVKSNVDHLIDEKKFRNLVTTNIIIEAHEFNNAHTDAYSRIASEAIAFREMKKQTRKSRKKILRYSWHIRNQLSLWHLNRFFLNAYALKHGGLHL